MDVVVSKWASILLLAYDWLILEGKSILEEFDTVEKICPEIVR